MTDKHQQTLFADDTNIFLFNKNIASLFVDASKALEKLNIWFSANKLSLNVDKTHYCIFRKRGNILDKNIQYPSLILDNHIIERVNYTKYLGIIIDEFITFKEHIDHLVNKLKQYCGIFYQFRSRLPKKCLRTIYFAMIHSHLNYGVAIYGNTTTSQLEPLLKINNKILRILQSKPLKTPVEQLYNNYNTLQITELRDYNILCLVHKFIHNLQDLPEIYHSYFTFNSEIHSYNTRTSSNLHNYSTIQFKPRI